MRVVIFWLCLAMMIATAHAGPVPDGYRVWPESISPDHVLGVIVPDADHLVPEQRQNKLIELATGKIIAVIASDTIFENENHIDLKPRWNADGSLLAWYADGKWGSDTFVLVRVAHHAVVAQIDVRELAVEQALAAARKANPSAYAAAKAEGAGNGSWFRDGFAIDVRPRGAIALPLELAIEMTSNPKDLDDYPPAAQLSGTMSAALAADGTIKAGRLTATTKRPTPPH